MRLLFLEVNQALQHDAAGKNRVFDPPVGAMDRVRVLT